MKTRCFFFYSLSKSNFSPRVVGGVFFPGYFSPLVMPPDIELLGIQTAGEGRVKFWIGRRACERKKCWKKEWKRRRRVIVQGILHPTAMSLFPTDKDVLTQTIMFPLSYLCLPESLYLFLEPLLVFLCIMQRWAPQPPRGAAENGRYIMGRLCMFVCLSGTHPRGLFKPLLERHAACGVNGELK